MISVTTVSEIPGKSPHYDVSIWVDITSEDARDCIEQFDAWIRIYEANPPPTPQFDNVGKEIPPTIPVENQQAATFAKLWPGMRQRFIQSESGNIFDRLGIEWQDDIEWNEEKKIWKRKQDQECPL